MNEHFRIAVDALEQVEEMDEDSPTTYFFIGRHYLAPGLRENFFFSNGSYVELKSILYDEFSKDDVMTKLFADVIYNVLKTKAQ